VLVERVTTLGWSMAQAATAAGVSVRTGYKWRARYRTGGITALADRASAPQRRPHRTAARREQWILSLRAGRLSGPAIAHRTGTPRATVGNVLRRHGLGRLAPLAPKPPVHRYEWSEPGALVHVDVKMLSRITHVGHRITGSRRGQPRGVGYEYVHVCVDDASRVAYVELLASLQQEDAIAFLRRAVAAFAARGVRVVRVMTDNGSAYVARRFAGACSELGLRHLRTRAYTPRTNGKAERFIQTLLREWAYARAYRSSAWRRRALRPWVRYYNERRPHTALHYRAPITRLQQVSA
jgi:transposase InsO family protein